MTLLNNIDRYFELETEDKLQVLKTVSKEIIDIIEIKQYNKDQTILFLERNIEIHLEKEQYEVVEILTKIKEVIQEDDGM